MNSRSPIGRALHMGYMRITRSVATSFTLFTAFDFKRKRKNQNNIYIVLINRC